MLLIGVLDVMGGKAVHARGGRRDEYMPLEPFDGASFAPGDAAAAARAYREQLGIDELYVADLDAIVANAPQEPLTSELAVLAPLWLDSGVSSPDAANRCVLLGSARVVIGLETLTSFDALAAICDAIGGERVAFSLDLRHGTPVARRGRISLHLSPAQIAAHAAAADASAVIVLDLARVGAAQGPDWDQIARVREAVPDVLLIAGGGVRHFDDLARLAANGCDGALVATALQQGRLTREDVVAARQLHPTRSR